MNIGNFELAEFMLLQEQIKIKTKRLEQLKEALKEKGSFATDEFVCSVDTQTRVVLPGLETVAKVIERKTLEDLGLIKTCQFVTVRVTPIHSNSILF